MYRLDPNSSIIPSLPHIEQLFQSIKRTRIEMIWGVVESEVMIDKQTIDSFSLLLKSPESEFDPFEVNPSKGLSLLHAASLNGKTEIVRCIVAPSESSGWVRPCYEAYMQEGLNRQCHHLHSTALNYACFGGHLEIFRLLVDAGASIEVKDRNGETSLQFAVMGGNPDIVRELIQKSGNCPDFLNAQDALSGLTALHRASIAGKLEIARILIGSGTEIDVLNKFGNTPLQEAAACGHAQVYWDLIAVGSLFKESDIPLIVKKGHIRQFIQEGLAQLSVIFEQLETHPSSTENEIIFIAISRILYTMAQILNNKTGMTLDPKVIILRIKLILKQTVIESWFHSMLNRCEIELAKILVSLSSSTSVESPNLLLKNLKNFYMGLIPFMQSLVLLPDLSNHFMLIDGTTMERLYCINGQISRLQIKDHSIPSMPSGEGTITGLQSAHFPLSESDETTEIGSSAASSSVSSSSTKPQSVSRKRERMDVLRKLSPIKRQTVPRPHKGKTVPGDPAD